MCSTLVPHPLTQDFMAVGKRVLKGISQRLVLDTLYISNSSMTKATAQLQTTQLLRLPKRPASGSCGSLAIVLVSQAHTSSAKVSLLWGTWRSVEILLAMQGSLFSRRAFVALSRSTPVSQVWYYRWLSSRSPRSVQSYSWDESTSYIGYQYSFRWPQTKTQWTQRVSNWPLPAWLSWKSSSWVTVGILHR